MSKFPQGERKPVGANRLSTGELAPENALPTKVRSIRHLPKLLLYKFPQAVRGCHEPTPQVLEWYVRICELFQLIHITNGHSVRSASIITPNGIKFILTGTANAKMTVYPGRTSR